MYELFGRSSDNSIEYLGTFSKYKDLLESIDNYTDNGYTEIKFYKVV